jgi:hypothetical protein
MFFRLFKIENTDDQELDRAQEKPMGQYKELSLSFSNSLKLKTPVSTNWLGLEKNPRDSIKSFFKFFRLFKIENTNEH